MILSLVAFVWVAKVAEELLQALSTHYVLGSGGLSSVWIGGVDDYFFAGFRLGKGDREGASDMGTSDELAIVDGEPTAMSSNGSALSDSSVKRGGLCPRLQSAGETGEVDMTS